MKALPKDLRYLLFDLDGTLTDSAEGILRCVQYALEQCGTPEPDAEKLRPFIGPPLLDSFQEFCGMPPARAAFAVEQYRKRFSTVGLLENAVYDGIPELLEQLREHGYVLAVATSKPEVYTLRILEHFDLFKYFTAVAGCDIHRAGETKADMIRLALRRLGLPEQEPPQTVMIGDRKHDVLGAKECRVPCIGVRYGYAEAGELEQYGADWVTDSVETLGKTAVVRTALHGMKALQNAVLFFACL